MARPFAAPLEFFIPNESLRQNNSRHPKSCTVPTVKRLASTLAPLGCFALLLPACEQSLAGSDPSAPSGDGDVAGDGDKVGDGDSVGDGDGVIVGDGDTNVPSDASCEQTGLNVGANVFARLSRVEYQQTVQDLFQLPVPPEIELIPADIDRHGFTSFAELQTVTAQHLKAYLDTAGLLFDDLLAESSRFNAVVGCVPGETECLSGFISRFGRLAFRRTLTTEELTALTTAAQTNAVDAEDQIRYAVEALLASPHFLYRVEVGNQPEGLSTLTPEELASKLSFTLFGRGPSATLLDRAEAGELSTADGLISVAREMLNDPKSESFYQAFFRQWLGYGQLRAPIEPPADWSDALMPDMVEETDTLISEHAWVPGKNLWDILTANHTTVTPALASFYGLSTDPSGYAEFSAGSPRENSGILGHASILSQKTDGDKISVRGNWLRSTFLCEDLEIPAAIADALGEQLVGLTSTQIIEKRNSEQPCMNCHSVIDPIGVGLAQFDATGRFDASVDLSMYPVEPGFPDAPDPQFRSLAELTSKLRELPQTNGCLTESAFIYAYGRDATGEDACTFEGATNGFIGEGGSFASLIFNLVVSDGFRLRRAPSAL